MESKIDPVELNVTREMLKDFAAKPGLTAEEVYRKSWSRYQKFVNVHPFYDGNGRVARIITNTYLNSHGLTIAWSEIDSKGKFIHKLNYCHRNPDEETYQLLAKFIKDYTIKLKDFES